MERRTKMTEGEFVALCTALVVANVEAANGRPELQNRASPVSRAMSFAHEARKQIDAELTAMAEEV